MKVLFLCLALGLSLSSFAQEIVFIINAGSSVSEISQTELANIFLKKTRFWPDGSSVRFFDREDNTLEKKAFLKKYIHRSQREIDQFWIGQKLYTGNAAPTQLASDTMTISLVSRFPGAIGYIRATELKEYPGIKKLVITGID